MATRAKKRREKFKQPCNSPSIPARRLESRRRGQRITRPLRSEVAGAAFARKRNDLLQKATALAEDARESYKLRRSLNLP